MNGTNQLFLLAVDAYRTAQSHGFWEVQTSRSPVATKVALIHTEIDELRRALQQDDGDPAEELADVIIRTLDLAVAIDVDVSAYSRIVTQTAGLQPDEEDLPTSRHAEDLVLIGLHTAAANVTAWDRRDEDVRTADALLELLQTAFDAAGLLGLGDIEPAIREKMARNRERPRLHGRKY